MDDKATEAYAALMLGQFPNFSVHDPETYTKSVARVFAIYPEAVVKVCIDPATGIATKVEKAPNIKVLTDWLRKEAAHQQLVANAPATPAAALPRYRRPTGSLPPNLFVPSDNPHYAAMVERHNETRGELSRYEERVCADQVRRSGIWIPLGWWGEGGRPSAGWKRPEPKLENPPYPTDDEMMAL